MHTYPSVGLYHACNVVCKTMFLRVFCGSLIGSYTYSSASRGCDLCFLGGYRVPKANYINTYVVDQRANLRLFRNVFFLLYCVL